MLDGRDLTLEEARVVTRDGDAQLAPRVGQVGLDRAVERQLALRRRREAVAHANRRELVDGRVLELRAVDLDENLGERDHGLHRPPPASGDGGIRSTVPGATLEGSTMSLASAISRHSDGSP